METISMGWGDVLNGVLAVVFGFWSIAVKGARDDIKGVRDDLKTALAALTKEISELRKDFNLLSTRVSVVEVKQKHLHPEDG